MTKGNTLQLLEDQIGHTRFWQERAEVAETEVARLCEELAALRETVHAALYGAGDAQIVFAPKLLHALENIASEEAEELNELRDKTSDWR